MRRFYFHTSIYLLLGMLSSCGVAEPNTRDDQDPGQASALDPAAHCPDKDQSWTFLFYIVADDGSQSFDTSTARYLNTMPTLAENVEALVLLDRCSYAYWPISTTDGRVLDTCAQLYRIQKDGTPQLIDRSPYKLGWLDDTEGDVDMGSAATLTSFIEYGMKEIETTNYGLILSGHGNGDQVGFDSTNDTSLNHQELGYALEQALGRVDEICHPKLDLVVLAACAMATAGIYSSLTPHAHWLIASQENIYGYDFTWMHGLGGADAKGTLALNEVSQALSDARINGETGTGQQVTWALSQEKSETLQRITSEVGAMLISENVTKRELEDASFNPRTYDLRLVTEKVQSDALLIELDALLEQAVFEQTELSESLRDSIQGYGISVTTSDLGLPGSLLF